MIEIRLYSSMAKVFMSGCPERYAQIDRAEGLLGERVAFQLAYRSTGDDGFWPLKLAVNSPIARHISVREVRQVPVGLPTYEGMDDDYLSKDPGLFPDLLEEAHSPDFVRTPRTSWQALWLTIDASGIAAGTYRISITLSRMDGSVAGQASLCYKAIDFELPAPELIHTKWFHCDALAQYYHVPVFSEEHWRIMRAFMEKAVELGINMILTPIHTPPLDTDVGAERLTVQLVDVALKNGVYTFGFNNLKRYIDMALQCGIQYFEMAHLFTQWGAASAPKIVATVDGVPRRVFGWDTPATGEYAAFLARYLPALTDQLRAWGIAERCYFHISDEPGTASLNAYKAAKAVVAPYLEGFPIMDAMSTLDFYEQGVCTMPIPANNHIKPFLDANVPDLWTYYCCSQANKVSNLFIAMPSERTRMLGVQLYLYQIKGFLQWGFNYYFSQNSRYLIDPCRVTDGDLAWPAGDPFQVYPGKDGTPLDSIHALSTKAALCDLAALQALEKKIGRDKVCALIQEGVPYPITFDEYPRSETYLWDLRARVNQALVK